jgi:glucose dehydrogenase
VFVGQTAGTYLAYDAQTGAQLWASPRVTDAIINAPGMTYAVNGKQYVTVMARGIKGNDTIYTYALPS